MKKKSLLILPVLLLALAACNNDDDVVEDENDGVTENENGDGGEGEGSGEGESTTHAAPVREAIETAPEGSLGVLDFSGISESKTTDQSVEDLNTLFAESWVAASEEAVPTSIVPLDGDAGDDGEDGDEGGDDGEDGSDGDEGGDEGEDGSDGDEGGDDGDSGESGDEGGDDGETGGEGTGDDSETGDEGEETTLPFKVTEATKVLLGAGGSATSNNDYWQLSTQCIKLSNSPTSNNHVDGSLTLDFGETAVSKVEVEALRWSETEEASLEVAETVSEDNPEPTSAASASEEVTAISAATDLTVTTPDVLTYELGESGATSVTLSATNRILIFSITIYTVAED